MTPGETESGHHMCYYLTSDWCTETYDIINPTNHKLFMWILVTDPASLLLSSL